MKIIVVGAGTIGANLAKSLAEENHEVYLIEQDADLARKVDEKLDVKVVIGNGADPTVLKNLQVDQADMVLAVTASDETNIVVSSLAGILGAKKRIARVRNPSLNKLLYEHKDRCFLIDEIINPEQVAAEHIVKTIKTPGSREVADFANGRLFLRGFEISEKSPLCSLKVQDLKVDDFPWPFLIIAVVRNGQVSIPKGDTQLKKEDRIYVLLPAGSLAEFLTFIDPDIRKPQKVIISGATFTGEQVAISLRDEIRDLILLEEDQEKAEDIAGRMESTRVIKGSPTDTEILKECGIEAADAFIATSNNDHSNLVSAVLAKKLGAKETIIITHQPDYISIIDALDIDAIINPRLLAVDQILRLVRGKGIQSVTKLIECEAETIELIPEKGSPITKAPLKNLTLPKNSIIGAVCRGSEVILARGDTHIQEKDKVIVFCQENAVKRIQELFTTRK